MINWLNQLNPSDPLYWPASLVLLFLILAAGWFIKQTGRRLIRSEQGTIIWNKMMNLLILFAAVVFAFNYLSQSDWMMEPLFVLGDSTITPMLILVLVFAVILAVQFSKVLRENILAGVYRKYKVEISIQATINTLLHYSILLLIILFALNSLGFRFGSLTVFAGVLGVGIGFGLKDIMNNFVSGLIILFNRPIKVGDRVVVDGNIIDIEKIQIRNTIGRTRANERLVIPNSYFLQEKFINRSYVAKQLRIHVAVGVPYGSDLELAASLLEEAVYELRERKWPDTMEKAEPRVFLEEFRDRDILLKVWFFIEDQANEFEFIIPSDLRYIIYRKFNENGVEFAVPRQEILIINDEEEMKHEE